MTWISSPVSRHPCLVTESIPFQGHSGYCFCMPASLATLAHLARSAGIILRISAGVRMSTSALSTANRFAVSGSTSIAAISVFSLLRTAIGVPAVVAHAHQISAW
jgi:hypothetical protein